MEIIYLIVGLFIGFAIMLSIYFVRKNQGMEIISKAKEIADKTINDAKQEAETLKKQTILDGKEELFKTKQNFEKEIEERKAELRLLEKKSNDRLANLDKRFESLDKKETHLSELEEHIKVKEQQLNEKEKVIEATIRKQEQKLIEIAGLTREEAIEVLRNEMLEEARIQAAHEVKQILNNAKQTANKEASAIIVGAIQRLAVDHVSESTVSVVSLPDDEMKGRIIGREGRNIRAFEKASGVDLIVDDTPEAVVLSCFDPVRREIARLSLEKLILDGRIHPGRIEDVIEKTRQEMEENLVTIGEQACLETNIHNISPNLVKIIGRLQYRTSYGQNVLKHSIEASYIAGIMAAELGLDQSLARRAAFLHDIGKAIDHEFDGSHAVLGANLARKNGENKIVINAIESHHEEVPMESVYAALTQAADAISGARPGARREMLENYMQRLEKLEEIANRIEGVTKSYAIQAGREVRIIVDPDTVSDDKTVFIASDIAKEVEREMQYPGQIKITVLRETRQTAIAK